MKALNSLLINNVTFTLITLVYWVCLSEETRFSSMHYSLLFCFYFSFSLIYVWNIKKLSPFFIFLTLSNILFIGGRFWGILINPELDLMEGTFFHNSYIDKKHMNETLRFVILFIFLASLGYKLCPNYGKNKCILTTEYKREPDRFLKNFWWIVLILAVYGQIQNFIYAFTQGSYLAMYEGQTGDYTAGGSLGKILLYICFGLSMAYGSAYTQKRYLILFFVYSTINILIGGRGTLGAVLMFSIWYYSLSHKINIVKLAILCVFSLLFLLWIFSFSIRQADSSMSLGLVDTISYFLYSQGISLAVFDQSRDIIDYPALAYIQSIIPGSSTIYSLFTGVSLSPQDVSFSSYLSYSLNPSLFANGNGLGWTLMGDLYLFGGRTYIGFGILSFIFGYLCSYIESKASLKIFYKVLIFAIFMRFVLLPRAGLNTIIPFIAYVYVIHTMFKYFVVSNNRVQN